MLPFKKIISPRRFLQDLDPKKFSWEMTLVTFAALFLSVVVSALVFAGVNALYAFRHALTPGYGLAIIIFGAVALIRMLFIRFIIALGIGYALTEYNPDVKRSGITMWQMVNTYFYALFLLVCAQILLVVLGGAFAFISTAPLYAIGSVFSNLFDIAGAGLAGYWVYRMVREKNETTGSKETVVEGTVVKSNEKNDSNI